MTKKNNSGLTIIEVLFALFIISTLTIGIISAINFTIMRVNKYSAELHAYMLIDNYINSMKFDNSKIIINNIEYNISSIIETQKISDFLQLEAFKFELERYETPVRIVKIEWSVDNEKQQLIFKKLVDI